MTDRKGENRHATTVVATAIAAVLVSDVASRAGSLSCDAATQARIEFLEQRLDAGVQHARWWWQGWMTIFLLGTAIESIQGATTHDHGAEADAYLSVAESVGGIADLLLEDRVALRGSSRSRALPAGTPEECARRLEAAEHDLADAADDARERWRWPEHLINLSISVAHGGLVAGVWGDRTRGATSFAINEVFSEAQVWTEPSRAAEDWAEYRRTFGVRSASLAREPGGWQLIASPLMIGLRYTF